MRQVEIDAPEIQSGLTNDFQEARDRVDQVYLQTMLKDGAASEPGTSSGLTANFFKGGFVTEYIKVVSQSYGS